MKEPPEAPKKGPRVVREWLSRFRAWAISAQPLGSIDCDIHETPAGRVILPKATSAAGGGAAAGVPHPYRVSVGAAEDGTPRRIVEYRSGLIAKFDAYASGTHKPKKIAITGLATQDEPQAGDAGWRTLLANDLIWLEIGFETAAGPSYGDVVSAAIKSFGAGDGGIEAGGLFGWEVEGGGDDAIYHAKTTRVVIASCYGTAAGFRVVQRLNTDIALVAGLVAGRPVYLPAPLPFDIDQIPHT